MAMRKSNPPLKKYLSGHLDDVRESVEYALEALDKIDHSQDRPLPHLEEALKFLIEAAASCEQVRNSMLPQEKGKIAIGKADPSRDSQKCPYCGSFDQQVLGEDEHGTAYQCDDCGKQYRGDDYDPEGEEEEDEDEEEEEDEIDEDIAKIANTIRVIVKEEEIDADGLVQVVFMSPTRKDGSGVRDWRDAGFSSILGSHIECDGNDFGYAIVQVSDDWDDFVEILSDELEGMGINRSNIDDR